MNPGLGRARLIAWACAAAAACVLMVCCPQCDNVVKGEPMYYAGDSLGLVITGRDSLGAAVLPDTTRLFVYRLGVVVDSSDTYPGTIDALAGSPVSLIATYVIPSSWSGPYDLTFTAYGTADGITDEMQISPGRVRVNAIQDSVRAVSRSWDVRGGSLDSLGLALVSDSARVVAQALDVRGGYLDSTGIAILLDEEITAAAQDTIPVVLHVLRSDTTGILEEEITTTVAAVDSFTINAIQDLYAGMTDETSMLIDTCSFSTAGVYYGGTAVATGDAYLVSGDPWTSNSQLMGYSRVSNGYWWMKVPRVGSYPDTLYFWAFNGVRYTANGTQVIITSTPTVCEP